MAEIINQQRKIKVEKETFQVFTETIVNEIAKGKTATVAFISDCKMIEMNGDFRGKNSTTDVLSFPFETDQFDNDDSFLGDIVISIEQAERQAVENQLTLELEVKQLILHGFLHLLGFDHETDNGEMNKLELELREKFDL